MARTSLQSQAKAAWALAKRQHWVITRGQLLELGFSRDAIQHRLAQGRLHSLHRGVYAVGRPEVGQRGRWMAAVLSCGPEALLGYRSAAALWGILDQAPATVEIVVPMHLSRRRPGIRVHRRTELRPDEHDSHDSIPVTSPAATMIDIAAKLGDPSLAAAVNSADRLGLVDPEALRAEVEATSPRPGLRPLLLLLDRHTFTRTDSELERQFLALIRAAELPEPQTQVPVNGFRVDFHWPKLGLVAETDGLRYHRTPIQQARDLRREQVHVAAGLTTLRFPATQIQYEPATVVAILFETISRLESPVR